MSDDSGSTEATPDVVPVADLRAWLRQMNDAVQEPGWHDTAYQSGYQDGLRAAYGSVQRWIDGPRQLPSGPVRFVP